MIFIKYFSSSFAIKFSDCILVLEKYRSPKRSRDREATLRSRKFFETEIGIAIAISISNDDRDRDSDFNFGDRGHALRGGEVS